MEIPPGGFRCPFEIEGDERGTILEVTLSATRDQRLEQIRSGLQRFMDSPESPGAKFSLSFANLETECASLQDLKAAILPYQAEFTAVQLEMRLPGLLPQHAAAEQIDPSPAASRKKSRVDVVARSLRHQMLKSGSRLPQTTSELAVWIQQRLDDMHEVREPNILVCDESDGTGTRIVLSISARSMVMNADRDVLSDSKTTRDFFVFVRGPFYPKEFGRFSEQVEVVFTRKSDIQKLSRRQRHAIRLAANTVYLAHGVPVSKLEQQSAGVWIPESPG